MKTSPLPERPPRTHALGIVASGLAAGFAGTLLLSLFERLLRWNSRRWADDAAPAAPSEDTAVMTPAEALTLASGPGPEGAAERFALKVASGLFGRDLSASVKPAGLAVHVMYGSFWGAVFSIVQSSLAWSPALAGLLFGVALWAFGPAWLVPAMKLMRYPDEQPPATNFRLVAGHILYGLAVSGVFARFAGTANDE